MRTESWLDTAVSGIRFGPDRRAVRAELEGHIEDRMAGPGWGICGGPVRSCWR